jgi:VWFA-related protein
MTEAPARGAEATPSADRPETRSGRAFAIVVDDMGLDQVPNALFVIKALASWVGERPGPLDEVTLVTTSGSVFWSGRIGRGRADLLAALERIRGLRPPPPYDEDTAWKRRRIRAAYGTIERVAGALAGWRGRKAIFLIAQSFIHSLEENTSDAAIRASLSSNAAVYYVDAYGLMGPSVFRADAPANPPPQDSGVLTAKPIFGVTGGWNLADATGGSTFEDSNDLRLGLDLMETESRAYYLLGYQPEGPFDRKWHKIEVKVSRPGVTLRARRGYYATPRASTPVLARELALRAALEAPTPPRDFASHATVLHFEPQGAERQALFLLEVPPGATMGSPDRLTFLAFIKDSSGKVVVRLSHESTPAGPPPPGENGRARGKLFRHALRLAPGTYALEWVVLDDSDGGLSRELVTFDIPAAHGGLAVSSLVPVRGPERSAPGAEAVPDPLHVGSTLLTPRLGAPIQPETDGELPLFLRIYPGASPDPVELELTVARDAAVLSRAKLDLPMRDVSGSVSWVGGLRLAPGRYELCAVARQGTRQAEERLSLDLIAASPAVDGPPPPAASDP